MTDAIGGEVDAEEAVAGDPSTPADPDFGAGAEELDLALAREEAVTEEEDVLGEATDGDERTATAGHHDPAAEPPKERGLPVAADPEGGDVEVRRARAKRALRAVVAALRTCARRLRGRGDVRGEGERSGYIV